MTVDKKDLIEKLKRLCQSDNPHEAESAREKLMNIIRKYNIDESILEEDRVERREFIYHNEIEKRLLAQILYAVTGSRNIMYYPSRRGKQIKLVMECTYAESVEINIRYEFYKELIYDDLDVFISAFIHKHRIFPVNVESTDPDELSEEEIQKLMRMQEMMKGLNNKDYVHRITG